MSRILVGDCREVLKALPDASVDSIVTDPPYELGFMGKKWDSTGIANSPAVWAECLRVLKPGGYLLSFGGTRTSHRMACAIEDAGFEIRDQIGWAYGSGFPKSHNGEWGGTALKPAWEPICMARKPLIGTVEANWREHGTGALNVKGCRVDGTEGGRWPANLCHDGSDEVLAAFPPAPGQQGAVTGREPSPKTRNVLGTYRERAESAPRLDAGSAARFFYCAKASKADRDGGLGGINSPRQGNRPGSPDETGKFPDHDHRVRGENTHPTVKPTELMRWLCRLVTPKGGTVLDPFAGSGSTGKAARLEGFGFIGVELSPAYAEIARKRIAA